MILKQFWYNYVDAKVIPALDQYEAVFLIEYRVEQPCENVRKQYIYHTLNNYSALILDKNCKDFVRS